MAFNSAKGVLFSKANPAQYPAPKIALESIEKHVNLPRDKALEIESAGFAKAAKTPHCNKV
jgi:3-hydroxyacyl-CoA dehydrogenase/enoyl-CoA hydratase/3-hydroxybutyryl-CoA epimerase/enoyl-CoA isomerase